MKIWTCLRAGAAAVIFALAACASDGGPAPTGPERPAPQGEYHLGPGDKLHISVFGEADLTGDFIVGPDGSVSYPLIGAVPAQGLSVDQFVAALSERLREGYVNQPRINVAVITYRPYYILGEVGSPGTYPFSANLSVVNAVATAGGFTYRADTHRVFIKHSSDTTEHEYRLTGATLVEPGDTVRIPERRF